METSTKFCKYCGEKIAESAVVCPKCGRQVEAMGAQNGQIVINNVAGAQPGRGRSPRLINKWVAFCLCLFLGIFGAHKFYEGKIGTGILYLCTAGLFVFGWLIDLFNLLGKSNPYTV